MGRWVVDTKKEPGILHLELEGSFNLDDMKAFVAAHNKAIDEMNGAEYRVFCDIRKLAPLKAECAELMEKAKQHSSSQFNFRGSAVWVASSIVAMQHKRTSQTGGVLETELISEDETALREHLRKVFRRSQV